MPYCWECDKKLKKVYRDDDLRALCYRCFSEKHFTCKKCQRAIFTGFDTIKKEKKKNLCAECSTFKQSIISKTTYGYNLIHDQQQCPNHRLRQISGFYKIEILKNAPLFYFCQDDYCEAHGCQSAIDYAQKILKGNFEKFELSLYLNR